MKKYKRYEGLFLAPNMCDGIYDTYNDPNYENELSSEQIIDIMNDKNNEIQVWKKKYDNGLDVHPTAEILNKISRYFSVSVDYLLGNTDRIWKYLIFLQIVLQNIPCLSPCLMQHILFFIGHFYDIIIALLYICFHK